MLSVSVSAVVLGFVVGLLYWSSSCSPSLMLVVLDTPSVFGVGVMTTWVGGPAVIVSACVPGARPDAAAVIVGAPATVSP